LQNTPPGLRTYVDVFAALVPAEVLAAFAFLLPVFTTTDVTTGGAADSGTISISEPTAALWAFWGLAVASALLYVFGRLFRLDKLDIARILIPPLAFIGWIMLQHPVVFAAAGGPEWSTGERTVVAVVLAIVLSAAAASLAHKADEAVSDGGERVVREGLQD
jgi:hypothetical protein